MAVSMLKRGTLLCPPTSPARRVAQLAAVKPLVDHTTGPDPLMGFVSGLAWQFPTGKVYVIRLEQPHQHRCAAQCGSCNIARLHPTDQAILERHPRGGAVVVAGSLREQQRQQ